jgi:hypothetical protein
MTPDPLTQLLTDLRALVATMLPAIDLLQTDLAGTATHDRQRLQRAEVAPALDLGNEGPDVPARVAAPRSQKRPGGVNARPSRKETHRTPCEHTPPSLRA